MLDYDKILDYSLNDLKNKITSIDKNIKFKDDLKYCIEAIELLIDREISGIKEESLKESLIGIKYRKANGFKDSLQRILFFNQLMWQTGHYLNGLGRLDKILVNYYKDDIKNNKITKQEVKNLFTEFLEILHDDYYFKSNSLSGDTGQIIILGGYDDNKNYVCNDLTYMFIEILTSLQIPDPKILLRVSKDTPRKLMELSTKCIATGIGCPLFANDDIIIPRLIDYKISIKDAYNYGTAACWEPFITGKSFDQNNLKSISFMKPLNNMLTQTDLDNIKSTNDLIEKYEEYLKLYLNEFINKINNIKFGYDPLLSLLTDDCIELQKDISFGGAKYNEYGFTSVGLSNVINSIMIVDKFVFNEKKYTLSEFYEIIKNNFENNEKLLKEIKLEKDRYGKDDNDIINLTNEIIKYTTKILNRYKNPLGGRYKFGLSAPSYIDESNNFPASFDGRKNGEPFGVHISCDNSNGYSELIQFASKLDYSENRFNGNVIDFFVSPNFIIDNFDKFVDFLILSVDVGFFEMQMNVVSSKTLIEAKNDPEKFPNLIVRVWGFSAYFKDLPEEYKNYLIERSLKSEGNC